MTATARRSRALWIAAAMVTIVAAMPLVGWRAEDDNHAGFGGMSTISTTTISPETDHQRQPGRTEVSGAPVDPGWWMGRRSTVTVIVAVPPRAADPAKR